jgi:hypothetical protein
MPGSLGARTRIERALSNRAVAAAFAPSEKAALLDAADIWLTDEGFDAIGSDVLYLRTALECELGVPDGASPVA